MQSAENFDWTRLSGPQVNPHDFDWSRLGPPKVDPNEFDWSKLDADKTPVEERPTDSHFAIARGVLLNGGDLTAVRRDFAELEIHPAITQRVVQSLASERIRPLVYAEAAANLILDRLTQLGLDAEESREIYQAVKLEREERHAAVVRRVKLQSPTAGSPWAASPFLLRMLMRLLGW